ncbi:ankyrin repeat protein [Anseongella ginsenosidimutans]|uniref:Ankyrin repeat protein n=1 Tax=Anseongella ginsenosidimutans TaxID=496056 RepID=A0A4R3KUY5_9SPHI|nr:ankyrin repeat domain-containing protein [Anseongella ginsenosidimutans]QEC51873.1 ankyrin repeat domain-containing protein [Anseongella ginsenosidimutans]TCS89257.1 ankyrin repeat protein [Anseongella ginsenosidimutans]
MNSQHRNCLHGLTRWTGILSLSLLAACAGKGHSSQADDTPGAERVEAPKVDIHTAVASGNEAALRQHIAAGTDINTKDPFGGSSPLITAAVFGQTDMAGILIESGADLDFRNNEGSTALLSAAFFGRPEIVRLLLDAGADKSIENKYGATAYESVAAPFAEMKSTYDMMGKLLKPLGLKLDYAYLEKIRPVIAEMLK